MKNTRKEAYRLIELAQRIGPEGEGIELTDMEYEFQEMAELRNLLSSVRKAIDIVNKGLARAWHAKDPKGYVELENVKHWLGITKKNGWQDAEAPLRFATWLKEQDPELIAAILPSAPPYGLRMTPLPSGIFDSFFEKLSSSSEASIQSKPL